MGSMLTIGQAARAAGVSARTIRYYEQVGVLPPSRRTAAGYRQYAPAGVERLLFVRRARALGLPVGRLRSLGQAIHAGPRAEVRPRLLALVREQLSSVERRLTELQLLQGQLERVLDRLGATRPAPGGGGCRCLDVEPARAGGRDEGGDPARAGHDDGSPHRGTRRRRDQRPARAMVDRIVVSR